MMGMMLAVIMTLSYFEHTLPQLPFLPPNFRYGLSNIVTMYCFFFIGKSSALTLNALKSLFVVFTRSPYAGLLSFSGGMLSIIVLMLLVWVFKDKLSYVMAGICGAIAHNLGQIVIASLVVGTNIIWAYLPALLIMGVMMGAVTGLLLKVFMPVFKNVIKL